MQTSASEIANYKGNAAASAGSDPGVAIIAGQTDASRINERFDAIAMINIEKNRRAYEQKIKDRDDIFDKLASKDMTINQMLEPDRNMVRDKYLKPIRELLLRNPDIKSNPEDYATFQSLTQDFEEAKTYGQHRYIMMTTLDSDIAKELDPEKKMRMQAHRDKMGKQGIFEKVTPFQQTLDYSDKTFVTVPPVATKKQDISGDRVVTSTRSHTPLRLFKEGVLANYIEGPNKTLPNEMRQFKESFDALPNDEKAQRISQWNARIKQANDDENLVPGMTDYVEPIKSTLQKGPDGQDHLIVTETIPRVALAESLLKNYRNDTTEDAAVSALPSTIRKNEAAIAKDVATAKLLIPAQKAAAMARASESYAKARKAYEETKGISAKNDSVEAKGEFFLNSALQMLDPKAMKKFGVPRIEETTLLGKNPGLKGFLLHGKDYQGNTSGVLSATQLRALGKVYNSTNGLAVTNPDYVVFNPDDTTNPFYTTIYESKAPKDDLTGLPQADYKPTRTYDKVLPMALLERLVKGALGENASGKESEEYQAVMSNLKQRLGKNNNNVNANIMRLLQNKDWEEIIDTEVKTAQSGTKKTAPPAPKKKPTVKTGTLTDDTFK